MDSIFFIIHIYLTQHLSSSLFISFHQEKVQFIHGIALLCHATKQRKTRPTVILSDVLLFGVQQVR